MAIDSKEKRKSAASMLLLMPVGIEPNNSKPQAWRQTAGHGYYGILASITESTPPDNDADTTITAYLDRNGATIRPPRMTVMHAMDDLKNSALVGPDRLPMDAFEAKTDRYGRGTQEGNYLRLYLMTSRAGEPMGIRELVIDLDLVPIDFGTMTPSTGTGTDKDGASMETATVGVMMASDSLRNADLKVGSASASDDHLLSYQAQNQNMVGEACRVQWHTNGRAGALASPMEIELELDLVGEEVIRAPEV